MILKVFSVYDTKSLSYSPPFFMPTMGSAIRAFSDLAVDNQSTIAKHPSDYILMYIGEFNNSSGELIAQSVVKNLGLASDYVEGGKESVLKKAFASKDDNKYPSSQIMGGENKYYEPPQSTQHQHELPLSELSNKAMECEPK